MSQDNDEQGFFDRLAEKIDTLTSRAPFFTICAVFVVLWIIGLPFAGYKNDTYHLFLNSPTTAITFLLVAVAANAQRRSSKATDAKQNAIAEALADLLDDVGGEGHEETIKRLRDTVGLEDRTGA
jgi:low affinity Fe/Cu permease